jgi:hypothetical protein
MSDIRVRVSSRRPAEPSPVLVQPTDNGRYALGLADDGPGFETIACDVWLSRTRHVPRTVRQ